MFGLAAALDLAISISFRWSGSFESADFIQLISLIRVNGVCAGAVDTELWHRLPAAERLATFERSGARLPVGRVGKPEDVAEAYLYLMKAGFSTGETIVVDGGALQAP
jgi:NAD(P)-dependent dehydrogenase (short-subunit alcohol dehydrogenase family)